MWAVTVSVAYSAYMEHLANARPGGIIRVTDPTGIHVMAMGKPAAPSKCPCCGSRQFVYHHARRVCTYCRSEQ